MKKIGIVYGSKEQAKPVIVNIDTVYIHSDIEQVNEFPDGTPAEGIYKYNEIQYTKDEYIQLMANKQNTESEFSTELDLDIQKMKMIQETESELTTQHDIEILEIKKELEQLKEVIKKNETNK